MRKLLSTLLLTALATFVVGPFAPQSAQADTVTISPPRFELFGNPSDTITDKIKVRNDSDVEITYSVEVEDFAAEGEEGQVTFIDPQTSKDNFSLAKWVTFEPSRFTVPPAQERIISFTVRIPPTGEPGGHYGSVLIKRGGTETPGGAAVESRVGSLILLRVSGDVTEKLSLESFRTDEGFQQYGPINFNARFKNEGNVHVAPTGTIVITNIFGKKVKEIPVTPTAVLPDATRNVKATWDQKNLVGRYSASLVVNYGQNKEVLADSTTFIVFPLYLIVVIIIILLLLYFVIAKRKSFKRFINNLTRE